MANVLAVAEQKDGAVRKVSREVVAAARRLADALGGSVDAIVVGAQVDAAGAGLGEAGADRVLVASDPAFARYAPEGYAATVAAQAKVGGYAAVVVAASATGRDLGPRLAVRLDAPLAMDVTEVGLEGGKIAGTRPVYAGKALQRVVLDAPQAIVAIRPNTFTAGTGAQGHRGTVEAVAAVTGEARVTVTAMKASEQGALDVAEAPIVVSGGRGMKGPEHFHLIEELAKAFGNAAVGASRAVVDAGWRGHGEQVGQTGKTVSPQLYVAVGISGAIQHLAGMRTAKTIVAINKDKDAPIFKVADYGIVGDAFEMVPRLTEAIRNLRAGFRTGHGGTGARGHGPVPPPVPPCPRAPVIQLPPPDHSSSPAMDRDEIARELERLHLDGWGWALACCGRRREEALDVLQAAYLKVLDGQARFAGRSSFRTWLFGVIRLTAVEARRRDRWRRLRLITLEAVSAPADPGPDAAERLTGSEQSERLVAALARLSRRQREVLDLVFYHEMTIEEAAAVMRVSVGSARTHYERGKARLRALLAGEP